MHEKPVSESEGVFSQAEPIPDRGCPKGCGPTLVREVWESSCGGFEDEKISYLKCNYVRWIEGPDA